MLVIAFDLLHETIRASADEMGQGGGEWPPSPARAFSALVSGGGHDPQRRRTRRCRCWSLQRRQISMRTPPVTFSPPSCRTDSWWSTRMWGAGCRIIRHEPLKRSVPECVWPQETRSWSMCGQTIQFGHGADFFAQGAGCPGRLSGLRRFSGVGSRVRRDAGFL